MRDDFSEPYWHCFTIIVHDSFKTVDLCCKSESDVNVWVRGLQALVHKVDYKSCWSKGLLLWRMAYFKLVYTISTTGNEPKVTRLFTWLFT